MGFMICGRSVRMELTDIGFHDLREEREDGVDDPDTNPKRQEELPVGLKTGKQAQVKRRGSGMTSDCKHQCQHPIRLAPK